MPKNDPTKNWTNWGFTLPFFLFIIVGIFWIIQYEKGTMLQYFANIRTEALNLFFVYGTLLGEEPMYAFLTIATLFLISPRKALSLPILGFSIMGLSALLKNIFQHKRPMMYYGEKAWPHVEQVSIDFNFIEGVEVHTGTSSFPSGHTMSGFALFCLLALYLNHRWIWGLGCFLVALIVGLSRVYLFQHFFQDVLAGAVIGGAIAHCMYFFILKISTPAHTFWDAPLRFSNLYNSP